MSPVNVKQATNVTFARNDAEVDVIRAFNLLAEAIGRQHQERGEACKVERDFPLPSHPPTAVMTAMNETGIWALLKVLVAQVFRWQLLLREAVPTGRLSKEIKRMLVDMAEIFATYGISQAVYDTFAALTDVQLHRLLGGATQSFALSSALVVTGTASLAFVQGIINSVIAYLQSFVANDELQAAALRLQAKRCLTPDRLIEAFSVLLAELLNVQLGCSKFCADEGGSLAGGMQGVVLACLVQALISSAIEAKNAAGGWQPWLLSQFFGTSGTQRRIWTGGRVEELEHLISTQLRCSISGCLVVTPMRGMTRNVYERAELLEWLEKHGTDPITRAPTDMRSFYPCAETAKLASKLAKLLGARITRRIS